MDNDSSGCSFPAWGCFLMTMTFLILKLCGIISWAWVWIFSPLWIPAATFLALAILIFIVYLIALLINWIGEVIG